jgi:transcriptional regulator with XRE-family HTH domain
MSGEALRQARVKAGLSQVQAAKALGVSQPLFSLMESGMRPVTYSIALKAVNLWQISPLQLPFSQERRCNDELLAADLAALGYAGYAHLTGTTRNPAEVLFDALDRANLDARVVEALPWLPLQYPDMDWEWLVDQAKRHNRQNRLGFVLALAARLARAKARRSVAKKLYRVVGILRDARLVKNDTLCQESWPPTQRKHAHAKRSNLASYWNLDTSLTGRDLVHLSA